MDATTFDVIVPNVDAEAFLPSNTKELSDLQLALVAGGVGVCEF